MNVMTQATIPPTGAGVPATPPPMRTLARASAVSLAVALVVLLVAVLPAEYGLDPTGLGRALGFAALSQPAAVESVAPPQGAELAPVQQGPFGLYPREYRVDSREFVLGPYEYVEYKYHLAEQATMLFEWVADGDVVHDFHGVPDGAPGSAEQSYDKQARRRADGSFTAPFSGIHGWFWENPGGETVRVRVTTTGFYTSAQEFRFDGTRLSRDLRSLEVITPATN